MQPIDMFTAATEHERLNLPSKASERRLIRERAGVSQEVLCAVVGCSVPALIRWERDGITPRSPLQLERYERVLGAMSDYHRYRVELSERAARSGQ